MNIIKAIGKALFEEVDDEEELEKTQDLAKKVDIVRDREPKKEEVTFKREEVTVSSSDLDLKRDLESRFSNPETSFADEVSINEIKEEEKPTNNDIMFEEEDFIDNNVSLDNNDIDNNRVDDFAFSSRTVTNRELYQGKKETSYIESVNKSLTYNSTRNYYDSKDTKDKKVFRPSPIISPIYGVMGSEPKEEKKEIRVSSFDRNKKIDVDNVRNKAFGLRDSEPKKEESENKFYDVNANNIVVDRVTLSDADEYYNDLGLAYNVDYKESSKTPSRSSRYQEDKKSNNDNLFDLIESMYDKED